MRAEKKSIEDELARERKQNIALLEKIRLDIQTKEAKVDLLERQNAKTMEDLRERQSKDIEIVEQQHKKAVFQLLDQKAGL